MHLKVVSQDEPINWWMAVTVTGSEVVGHS
jgi:hypothetical protein